MHTLRVCLIQISIFVAIGMKKHFFIFTFLLLAFGFTAVHAQDKTLSASSQSCKLITPNAFTPNDDGVNDFFKLTASGTCEAATFSLKIFDRWGRLVFESADINTEWDGNFVGQQLKEGVYLWQAVAKWANDQSPENRIETKKGTLVLIR